MPLGGIFLQGAPWQAQAEEGVELAEISQFLQGCGVVYALLWQRGNVVWGPVLPTFWFQHRGAGTYPEWDIPVASVGCSLAAGDSLLLAMALPEISGVEGLPCQGRVVISCSKLCGHPTGAQTAERDREALVRHRQRLIHRLFCQSRDSCRAFFFFSVFPHAESSSNISLYVLTFI